MHERPGLDACEYMRAHVDVSRELCEHARNSHVGHTKSCWLFDKVKVLRSTGGTNHSSIINRKEPH